MVVSNVWRLRDLSLISTATWAVKIGLIIVSGFMTWRGMLEFATVASNEHGEAEQWLWFGSILVVTMLTTTMLVALIRFFSPLGFVKRGLFLLLYSMLALISVGFGYGFWWSLFSGTEVTETKLKESVLVAKASVEAAEQHVRTIENSARIANEYSQQKAAQEEQQGGSCDNAPNSGTTCRWLCKRRKEIGQRAASLEKDIQENLLEPISSELSERGLQSKLDTLLARDNRRQSSTVDTSAKKSRQAQIEDIWQEAQLAKTAIETRSQTFGREYASQFAELAVLVTVDDGTRSYCADSYLGELFKRAEHIANPVPIVVPPMPYLEGPNATAHAVQQLWHHVGTPINWLANVLTGEVPTPTMPAAMPTEIKQLIDSLEERKEDPVGGRGLAALLAAIGIDFALFVLAATTLPRPLREFERLLPPERRNRVKVRQILSRHVKQSDAACSFWRRCLLRNGEKAYFLAPRAEMSPEQVRHHVEAVEIFAAALGDTNGLARAWSPSGGSLHRRALDRLADWGWPDPGSDHYDLYTLRRGEFVEIANQLADIAAYRSNTVIAETVIDEGEIMQERQQPLTHRSLADLVAEHLQPPSKNANEDKTLDEDVDLSLDNELLHDLDNFDRMIQMARKSYGNGEDNHPEISVPERIQRRMEKFLQEKGIEVIRGEGKLADYKRLHHAIKAEASNKPAKTILKVVRPGYKKGDRILRVAEVVTSIGPESANINDK